MQKDKVDAFLDFILGHSKIIFPITIIAAVAITVSVGLNANRARAVSDVPDVTESPMNLSVEPDVAATTMPDAVEVLANPESQVQPETQELQRVSEEVAILWRRYVMNFQRMISFAVLKRQNIWIIILQWKYIQSQDWKRAVRWHMYIIEFVL